MGSITSGVGLVSGIPTDEIINQLIAVESRPIALVEQNTALLRTQQTAYQEVSARALSLLGNARAAADPGLFNETQASVSNEAVLTASTSSSTTPGVYQFTVDRLATGQQMISGGVSDRGATPLAPGGTTLTFEFGDASLDADVQLQSLNGGRGVGRGSIQITDRAGASAVVDLSRAINLDEVVQTINDAGGVNVRAEVGAEGLTLTDLTGQTGTLAVADVGLGSTATDLGLTAAAVGDTLTGDSILRLGEATLLSSLNDGLGVGRTSGVTDFNITRRDGSSVGVNLDGVETLGGVIQAIEDAAGAGSGLTAEVAPDGRSLRLVDTVAGPTPLSVAAANDSTAAADLGLLGSDGDGDGAIDGTTLLADLGSRLITNLRGGAGLDLGVVRLTARDGSTADVDLSGAVSVSELIDRINAAGIGVTAAVDNTRSGLTLTDDTGGSGSLTIADLSGSAAAQLNLAGDFDQDSVRTGNLELRYLSTSTSLASLNGGGGVAAGRFIITDSSGESATVDLSQGDETTLADVLREINSRGLDINARINDTGDGILLEDTGVGAVAIRVEEEGSTTARDLGLLGEAADAGEDFNGRFEKTIDVAATDTLDDVISKINAANLGVAASVLNDGSSFQPYRLTLSSTDAGKAGAFLFDAGETGLDMTTLTEAQDSVVYYGSSDPTKAVVITTPGDTLQNVVPGLTIDLNGLGTSTISVTRDDAAISGAVEKFIKGFNDTIAAIDKHDSYDTETEERGLLLGDTTVGSLRRSLFNLVNRRNGDLSGTFSALSQIGITVSEGGAGIELDSSRLNAALEADRDGVKALFSFRETEEDDEGSLQLVASGTFVKFIETLERATDSASGSIQRRVDTLDDQIELNNDRVEQLNASLERSRANLQAEFLAMEKAIGQLQGQQSALTQLSQLAAQAQASSGVGF